MDVSAEFFSSAAQIPASFWSLNRFGFPAQSDPIALIDENKMLMFLQSDNYLISNNHRSAEINVKPEHEKYRKIYTNISRMRGRIMLFLTPTSCNKFSDDFIAIPSSSFCFLLNFAFIFDFNYCLLCAADFILLLQKLLLTSLSLTLQPFERRLSHVFNQQYLRCRLRSLKVFI
jgi:hypothetical protein